MKRYKSKRAQSLIELSVFGALFLVFFGLLISIGLKGGFEQQILQQTFRKALHVSANKGSIAYIYVNDRHVPDATDTFALGSITPTAGVVSLTRDYLLGAIPDDVAALPQVAIDVKGGTCPGSRLSPAGHNSPCYYLAAGFWKVKFDLNGEECIKKRVIAKYNMIFGYNSVREPVTQEINGEDRIVSVTVIDSCQGEILSYLPCKRQCDELLNRTDYDGQDICIKDCELQGGSRCWNKCSQELVGEEIPFYCTNGILDKYFAFARNATTGLIEESKGMGLQGDIPLQTLSKNNSLRKRESKQNITTTDTFNLSNESERIIIFRPYKDETGASWSLPINNTVSENEGTTWRTPW